MSLGLCNAADTHKTGNLQAEVIRSRVKRWRFKIVRFMRFGKNEAEIKKDRKSCDRKYRSLNIEIHQGDVYETWRIRHRFIES